MFLIMTDPEFYMEFFKTATPYLTKKGYCVYHNIFVRKSPLMTLFKFE